MQYNFATGSGILSPLTKIACSHLGFSFVIDTGGSWNALAKTSFPVKNTQRSPKLSSLLMCFSPFLSLKPSKCTFYNFKLLFNYVNTLSCKDCNLFMSLCLKKILYIYVSISLLPSCLRAFLSSFLPCILSLFSKKAQK